MEWCINLKLVGLKRVLDISEKCVSAETAEHVVRCGSGGECFLKPEA